MFMDFLGLGVRFSPVSFYLRFFARFSALLGVKFFSDPVNITSFLGFLTARMALRFVQCPTVVGFLADLNRDFARLPFALLVSSSSWGSVHVGVREKVDAAISVALS